MRSAPVTIFYSVREHIHSFVIHCHSRVPLSRARAHRKLEFEHGRVNPILCLRDVLCRARRASDYICSFIGPMKCDERIVNHIAIVVCERVLDTLLNWLSHANHGKVYQRAQRALAMNTIHGAIVHFVWNEEEICNDERRTHVCTPTSSWLIVVNVLIVQIGCMLNMPSRTQLYTESWKEWMRNSQRREKSTRSAVVI